MIITDIIEIDKKRVKIYLDNEFAFVLYKGELHLYNIAKNLELSETYFDKITKEVLVKRAKLRAINLLSKKDYTEKALRKKLLEGYYNEQQIDETLQYLKSYGYIDDARYVQNYFSVHIQSKPKNKIVRKLVEKGISLDLIESLIEDIYERERDLTHVPDEVELGIKLLDKKKYDFKNSTNDKQKAYAYLLRNGICHDNAIKLLKDYEKKYSAT